MKLDKDLKIIYGSWIFVVVSLFVTVQFIPLVSAGLVKGTNCGFVTEAPTSDPLGTSNNDEGRAISLKVIAPEGAVKITEIGWYKDGGVIGRKWEAGIYDWDSGNNRPGNLIYVNREAEYTTVRGWQVLTGLNIIITEGIIYGLAIQFDSGLSEVYTNYQSLSGEIYQDQRGISELPDPFGTPYSTSSYWRAIYAVYEVEVVDTCTCPGLNEDWEIDHADACLINDDCDLGTGTLSFTGAGITRINATIHTTDLGNPGTSGVLKILSDCLIWVI